VTDTFFTARIADKGSRTGDADRGSRTGKIAQIQPPKTNPKTAVKD
jgi:hypothetical protein